MAFLFAVESIMHEFTIESDFVGILRNSEYESYSFVVWVSVVPDGIHDGSPIVFPEGG